MAVPYIFVNGTQADADEVNSNFRAVDNTETVLENSINIVKLQYTASVTDIDHDYMVVDVFTDASGYNDSVCTADSTSTYCCSGLSGYYINYINISCDMGTITSTFLGRGGNSTTYTIGCGNNFICGTHSYGPTYCYPNWVGCMCLNNFNDCLTNYKDICICMGMFRRNYGNGGHTSAYSFVIDNGAGSSHTSSYSNVCSTNSSNIVCYMWRHVSGNQYDFYVNGVCTGNSCMDNFLDLNYTMVLNATNACYSVTYGCFWVSGISFLKFNTSEIVTIPIEYATPAQTSYLALDKVGTGSVVYNIINATDSTCIACNLALNTHNLLTCCVCCHIYEIVQCNDAASCIKSYALLAGEA